MRPVDPDCGDKLSVKEFLDYCSYGGITPYDGTGYWGTETEYDPKANCFRPNPKPDEYRFVHWFNK